MIESWRKFRDQKQHQRRERVLGALALAARRGAPEVAGWPLMQATGLGSSGLYVALVQLERAGEITSRRADEPPPRHRLTEEG